MFAYDLGCEASQNGMSQQRKPKLEVVFFSYAGADPGAVMIKLPHAFSTVVAMFGSIFSPAVADGAESMLIPLIKEKLIFLCI